MIPIPAEGMIYWSSGLVNKFKNQFYHDHHGNLRSSFMRVMNGAAFTLPAKPVIEVMCADDQQHGRYNKECFIRQEKLFGD